jgi:hypothetical protein
MNTVPKFGRVELLLKRPSDNSDIPNIELLKFEDCGLMITGDYIVVIVDERDEKNSSISSTGKIFNLNQVDSYRTHTI